MSWISDSTELVTGWLSSAYAGHGILGANIPSTGDNGGSPVLNDGISPTKEYRWSVVTPPSSGTLNVYEDLTFDYANTTDGVYSFVYRLYEDGVDQGTATVTVQIGPSHTTISVNTDNVTASFNSQSISGAATTIAAMTANAVGNIHSSGYLPTGLTLSTDDLNAIVAYVVPAVIAALQATAIPVDAVKMNGASIIGNGSEADPWRGVGVSP